MAWICGKIKCPLEENYTRQGTQFKKHRKATEKTKYSRHINEWTDMDFNSGHRVAEDRRIWRKSVGNVSSGASTIMFVPGSR